MDVMEAILTRRSIRHYTGEPVSREDINALLKAAVYAPSAMKRLPWHFVVLTKKEDIERLAAAHPYMKFGPEAGCAIVVCADRKLNDNVTHLTQDTAAAIENMLLAARGMGLGTCWCGLFDNKERCAAVKEVCGIEDDDILTMSVVVVGHPAVEPPAPDRWDESRFHFDRW